MCAHVLFRIGRERGCGVRTRTVSCVGCCIEIQPFMRCYQARRAGYSRLESPIVRSSIWKNTPTTICVLYITQIHGNVVLGSDSVKRKPTEGCLDVDRSSFSFIIVRCLRRVQTQRSKYSSTRSETKSVGSYMTCLASCNNRSTDLINRSNNRSKPI